MTKPELGTKRDCPECGARFYDLHKEPAHCPKCHHEFIPEALLKPRKTRADDEQKPKAETDSDNDATEHETSLEDADEENKAPVSNRKSALDEEDTADDDDEDDTELASDEDIPDIEDIDVDLDDDEDDDAILEDEDDDDMSAIISKTDDEEQ